MSARVERTRAAVLHAATELLLEGGPNAITIDGVVARSGVAKSTMYRHWTTRDDLVADVFEHITPKLELTDPSLGFEDGLRDLVRRMVAMSSDPDWQRVLPAMMLLKMHQRDVAEVEARMQQEQLSVCTDVLRRGIAEGRISPDEDCDVLLMLLVGPLLMSALTGLVPADDAFADRVTDHFLAALGRSAVV